MKNNNLIFISAGEASGDLHATHLIKKLKEKDPSLQFMGLGGQLMREQNCEIIVDNKKMAVVGAAEIIKHLPDILSAAKIIKKSIRIRKPAAVILIDYPGFNLRLAKFCKKLGMKVIYYIPPQLWAWHQSRVKKIKKFVDEVAVIYPFELAFYEKHGVSAHYVGNPLLEIVVPSLSRIDFCNLHGLNPSLPIIGIAPGSRLGEIARMLETLLEAALILKKNYPDTQFLLPLAPSLNQEDLKSILQNFSSLNIHLIQKQYVDLFHCCDVMMAVSGTITVEIALARTPCVVIYKVSPFTYWLGKKLIHVKYMTLTNLLLDKLILPELIQDEASPQAIASLTKKLLTEPLERGKVLEGLIEFRKHLEKPKITDLAQLILENV